MSHSCSRTSTIFPSCSEYNPTCSPNLEGSSQSAASFSTSTPTILPLTPHRDNFCLVTCSMNTQIHSYLRAFAHDVLALCQECSYSTYLLSPLRSLLKFHLLQAGFPDYSIQNSSLHSCSTILLYPLWHLLLPAGTLPGSPAFQIICLAPMRHSVHICWMNTWIFPTQA